METPTVIADPEDNLPVEVVDLRPPRVPTFIWLDLNWSVTGRTVTRSAIHNGRTVTAMVTTATEYDDRTGRRVCGAEEPYLDDVYISVQSDFDLHKLVLHSADDFIECSQADLVLAHEEYHL